MSREFQSEFLSYVQRTAQSGEEKSDSKGEKAHPKVTRPEDSKINLRSKEADLDFRRGRGTLKDETVCISRERRSRSNDTITVKNKRGKSRRSASPVMSSPSGSKESPVSPVETLLANRPKRIIIPKALESTAGLSRIEEKELNKALYASLQETRSPDSRSQSPNPVESQTFQEFKNATIDSRFISHSPARNIESSEMPGVPRKSLSRHCKSETTPVKLSPSRDNSDPLHMKDDPVRHGYSTPKDKMKTEAGKSGNESDGAAKKSYFRSPLIHAQRKFAQGSSRPCSPSTTPRSLTPRNLTPSTTPQKAMATPGNVSNSSINTSSKLINTADFLTFLCLRGTDALPKHLDFTDMIFNNESVVDTPPPSRKSSGHKRRSRQGSPATSKSSSDIGDLSDLGVKPLSVRSGSGHSSPARKSKRGRSPKMPDLIPVTPPKTIRKSSNPPDLQPVYPMDVEKSSSSSASKSPPKSPRMAKTVQKLKEKLKRVKMHREREKLKKLKLKEKTVSQKRKHLIEECFASDSDQEIIFKKRKKHRISESQSRGKDKRSRSPTKSGLMKSQKSSKSLSSDTDESKSLQSRENSPSKQKKLLQLDIVKAKSKLKLKKSLKTTKSSEKYDLKIKKDRLKLKKRQIKSGKEKSDSDKESKQMNNSKVEKKVQRGNIKNEPHLRPRPSATQSSSEESSRRMRGRPPGSLNKAKKEPVPQKLPPSYPRRPFPGPNEASRIVDVPEFYPSEEQFQNPIEYINAIKHQAEPYGMCKIVPPISWKPEFKLNEDMRFFSQVQHVHKLHQRWGPNVQKIECIRKHLESQGVELQPIVFGGIELDMWNFLQTLQQHGGLQNVQNKKGFNKLADALKIPKLSQDRPARLYDAYCKYLLSYDTLSKDEKLKLEHQVLAERQKRKKIKDEEDECCLKGKSMSLKEYQRIARNIQAMYFKEDPSPEVVEAEFWKITHDRLNHLVVQCGHIDTATSGSGFPSKRESPFAKHGWNFTQLAQNSGSVLRHLGPVCGLTVPTIHVGMLFSTSCWSTDPHLLPYVVYSHSGADVIWNCIPKPETEKFKVAMKSLVPNLLSDDPIWLPEDTVMVPPDTLVSKGVSITKCIQRPREFLVVFPESYTSTISCGYSVSESVHYATPDWLPTGAKAAKLLKDSCERELFSMSRLLFNLARNEKTSTDLLKLILPLLQSIIEEEVKLRKELAFHGLKDRERMGTINENPSPSAKWRRGVQEEDDVCEVSKQICYSSRVENEHDSSVFSLQHAVPHIMKRKNLKHCRLYYRYTEKELMGILDKVKERIVSKTPSKSTEATSPRKKAKI